MKKQNRTSHSSYQAEAISDRRACGGAGIGNAIDTDWRHPTSSAGVPCRGNAAEVYYNIFAPFGVHPQLFSGLFSAVPGMALSVTWDDASCPGGTFSSSVRKHGIKKIQHMFPPYVPMCRFISLIGAWTAAGGVRDAVYASVTWHSQARAWADGPEHDFK